MKTPEQWANEIVVECSLSSYDLPALARWVRRVQQDARLDLALEAAQCEAAKARGPGNPGWHFGTGDGK